MKTANSVDGIIKKHQKKTFPLRENLFNNLINFITMEVKEMYMKPLQNMEHFQFASHVIAMCEESGIEKIKAVPASFLSLERKTHLFSQA